MSHLPRIHVEGALRSGPLVLSGAQGARFGTVFHARPGDEVRLFAGDGREWSATVEAVERQAVRLSVGAIERQEARPAVTIEAWCALIGAARFEWAVEKCVEAGADVIWPLRMEPAVRRKVPAARVQRWQRIADEASEQCGRLFVPVVQTPNSLEKLLSRHRGAIVFGDSDGMTAGDVDKLLPVRGIAAVVTGPEEGFTAEERARLRASGGLPLWLGPYMYRAETAAVVATAVVRQLADRR